jgi:hypothetical protein
MAKANPERMVIQEGEYLLINLDGRLFKKTKMNISFHKRMMGGQTCFKMIRTTEGRYSIFSPTVLMKRPQG